MVNREIHDIGDLNKHDNNICDVIANKDKKCKIKV